MGSIRRRRRVAAFVAILGLLFAGLAVAAYACLGCGEAMEGRSALCHQHCEQGDQSLDKPAAPHVAPAAASHVRVAFADFARDAGAPTGEQLSLLARTTAPPIAVRNCCLRI